tara:strand:- start:3091 stop:5541 length:2451 start_codon:yes stop_codon:yes gene_type:complete
MDKIESLFRKLTLEEKVSLLSGKDAWHTPEVDRLSIPSIKMTDGPNGARGDSLSGKTAASFPVSISLASTWNLDLVKQIGHSLGQESKTKDADVLLAPTINLHRHPLGGRHFECFSEDPFLTGKLAISYVSGVQAEGVACCLKHFVGNDTEFERLSISSNIDEKTLRELYLLPFEMAIKQGGALVVMSAYSKLNNIFCSSHDELLNKILKEEWSFPGFVVSDWGAALETIENANGGLDIEMPGPAKTWGEKLISEVKRGKVKEELIDDKVLRLMRVMNFTGRITDQKKKAESSFNNPRDRELIRKAGSEGMVLLKNEGILPFKLKEMRSLAVIGPNSLKGQIQGGGSAELKSHYSINPFEGIKNYVPSRLDLQYAKGCHIDKYYPPIGKQLLKTPGKNEEGFQVKFFQGGDFSGTPLEEEVMKGGKFWALNGFGVNVASSSNPPSLSVSFSADFIPDTTGLHSFDLTSIGPSRIKIDGKVFLDNWLDQKPGESFFSFGSKLKKATVDLIKDKSYFLEIEYKWIGRFPAIQFGMLPPDSIDLMEEALNISRKVDGIILVVGTNSDWETEGIDRSSMDLPLKQNELIEKICEVNPNTVVVLNTGSPNHMPWIDKSKCILQSWFPGQEFGNSLADIIFGAENPSGKLPTTFPVSLKDTPAFNFYPGQDSQMQYGEGVYIGYRWYEKEDIKPLFPFGHGLSYTNFLYSEFRIIPPQTEDSVISCEFKIENIGPLKGKEVAQCYIGKENSSIAGPVKILKAFKKIELEPKEAKKLIFNITERDLSYWDIDKHSWVLEPAKYIIYIGSSSEDVRGKRSVWLG